MIRLVVLGPYRIARGLGLEDEKSKGVLYVFVVVTYSRDLGNGMALMVY